jgi:hypothetical protein
VPPDADEPFDPNPILERFARAGIDFVVIGGVAGAVHGSAFGTFDLDLAYGREGDNLERIAEVLGELGATLRGVPADPPFELDARSLAAGGNVTFSTPLGSVDLLAYPEGAPPYERLRDSATVIQIAGYPIRICSLDHLIAMREATGRPRDKERAQELRMLSDVLRAPRPEPSG